MTDAEKAYQYFVTAIPESESQAKAYFWARKALQPKNLSNEPLTLEELRGMDGQPVWITPLGFWALVIAKPGERVKLICNDGESVWADKEIELVGPVYRRPTEED